MPRKNKDKAVKNPNELNPLEAKLKALTLENEMLDKALKERQKKLDHMERLNAQERLLTGEEPAEEENDDQPASPFFPRNLGIGGGGVVRNPNQSPEQADEYLRKQEDFERRLNEFQDTDGKVHIYRLKDGNNWAKMGTFSAKEWGGSLETVAKKFGGGTFKVRLHAPNGEFAGENIQEFDEEAYPKPSAIQAAVIPMQNNNLDIVKAMQDMNEKGQERFMAMQAQFMQTMGQMLGQKSSMISNVQDLAMFKEMFQDKKPVNPLDNMNTLMTVLQQGMNLGAQTSAPVGEDGGILGKLLGSLMTGDNLARVGDIMRSAVTTPPASQPAPAPVRRLPAPPAPAAGASPAPQEAERPAANPNPPQKENTGMNLALLAYKPIIMGYARTKQSPKKTAEIIVSRIGSINEGWLLIVDDFLKLPDTKEKFVYSYAPELKEFDVWVDKVMKEMGSYIKELMTEAEAEEAEAEQAEQAGVPADLVDKTPDKK